LLILPIYMYAFHIILSLQTGNEINSNDAAEGSASSDGGAAFISIMQGAWDCC
jgi:hypothetical protein